MPDFFTVTVSQVTRRLSMIVKGDKALNDLYVSGEISNFTLHKASGHMYFTLKDETASIKCVMFAGNARSLDFTLISFFSLLIFALSTAACRHSPAARCCRFCPEAQKCPPPRARWEGICLSQNSGHIFSGAVTPMISRPISSTRRVVSASFRRASRTAGSASLMRQTL